MVEAVRIYVEGGGDDKRGKTKVREGFREFLSDLVAVARQGRIGWTIIACGGRDQAHKNYRHATSDYPEAFNVLLVDAEGPVSTSAAAHLRTGDEWKLPDREEEHCHLMVQMMEAWLIADVDALRTYYGQHFNANPIPNRQNVEEVAKDEIESALRNATRRTQRGEYHKIRHGPEILARLNAAKVRQAAPHCERLFSTLATNMGATVSAEGSESS